MKKLLLETDRLALMILDRSEAQLVLDYYDQNSESFQKVMPKVPSGFYTLRYHEALLMEQKLDMQKGSMLKIYVFKKGMESNIIADISLNQIIRGPLQSCFLGYKCHEKYRSQGYMLEALAAAIHHAFRELRLHRVEANIMPSNIASRKLAERLGFKEEGFSKKYLQINGRWEDHHRYAMINPESKTS